MPPPIDITGNRYGRLVAIRRTEGRNWLFQCDCGNETVIGSAQAKNGNTSSCGCLARDRLIERSRTHGLVHHPLYQAWHQMKRRCSDPKHPRFHDYGGRGITYCERWENFENFLADMGERPKGMTLDRINNNGNYEPGNCRWATSREQSENTSRSKFLTFKGKTQTVSQWARELKVDQRTINQRLYRGATDEEALTFGSVEKF